MRRERAVARWGRTWSRLARSSRVSCCRTAGCSYAAKLLGQTHSIGRENRLHSRGKLSGHIEVSGQELVRRTHSKHFRRNHSCRPTSTSQRLSTQHNLQNTTEHHHGRPLDSQCPFHPLPLSPVSGHSSVLRCACTASIPYIRRSHSPTLLLHPCTSSIRSAKGSI